MKHEACGQAHSVTVDDRALLVAFCMFDTFGCTKEQAGWKVGRFLSARQSASTRVTIRSDVACSKCGQGHSVTFDCPRVTP